MYCGSCIHDNTLAASLIAKGQDVTLVPTYTPMRTDETSVSVEPVFLGAINVYLQEKLSLFRHTPRFIDWLFNRPALINRVTKLSASTSAEDLGALTVSVLEGEEGKIKKELEKLLDWLASEVQPEIVHLTNSMFLGLAHRIGSELKVPVVCSLQGEDIFLEGLIEPYKSRAKQLIERHAGEIGAFISPSLAYADFMSEYVNIDREKIHVVPLGIDLRGHGEFSAPALEGVTRVGYLARICPEKGLHLLVEAFDLLVKRLGKESLQLEIAGYLGPRDQDYFTKLRSKIEASEWGDQVYYRGELDRGEKARFLSAIDILSVPTIYRDPKGLFVLEALANGTPVVQPGHGGFPELIEKTGGGILVTPNSPDSLADGIESLILDPARRSELGAVGKQAVFANFGAENLAEEVLSVYRRLLQ